MEKIFVKDDLNFLEFPNWVIAKRNNTPGKSLTLVRENGFYEMKSAEGLPVRFDKIVLYFLIHKLFQNPDENCTEVVTTRYEIAKNVLLQDKNFSQQKYTRIMLALKRWKAIYIKFEGVFYEDNNLSVKYFSIIDYVSLDRATNKLSIKFNEHYIKQLKESKFYKCINFYVYRKLRRPLSVRLYELLVKNFVTQRLWCIELQDLGTQLTLEKRTYPSQVLAALKLAIEEINENTDFKISCDYDKKNNFFIFRRLCDTEGKIAEC